MSDSSPTTTEAAGSSIVIVTRISWSPNRGLLARLWPLDPTSSIDQVPDA